MDEKIAPIGFVKCKKDNKLQTPHVNEVLSLIISFPFVFLLQLIFDFNKNSEDSDLGFTFFSFLFEIYREIMIVKRVRTGMVVMICAQKR